MSLADNVKLSKATKPHSAWRGEQSITRAAGNAASVLGERLIVLTLRTQEGKQLTGDPASDNARVVIPPKLGSVVVAIPAARLSEFAAAAMTSTFYLALSP